ncbi:MAG: hypothetical protein ACOC9X_05345 [bacterium]
MTEQEMVQAYVDDDLPADVEVITVPVRRDAYDGFRVALAADPGAYVASTGKAPDALEEVDVVELRRWDGIEADLVAGYSERWQRLVVGDWID